MALINDTAPAMLPPPGDSRARRTRRLCIRYVALAVLALLAVANVRRSLMLGMANYPPIWVVDAIPPALSDMAFHGGGHYTNLKAVNDTYYLSLRSNPPGQNRNSEMVARAMADVLRLNPQTLPRETQVLGMDDKGFVDFVKLSFRLFGYHNEKIIYLYYIIFFGSILLLVLTFGENLLPALAAAAFLVGHFMILPMVFHFPQLQSVLALRFLPVLSMMACLHCLLFVRRPVITVADMGALLLQTSLLVFVYHMRSVTLWQLYLIVVYGIAMFGVRALASRRKQAAFPNRFAAMPWAALIAPGLIFAGIVGLSQYRKAVFDQRYLEGKQIATRPIWHNFLSGFSFNPPLVREYGFKIDDISELRAAGRYLEQQGRGAEWVAMGGTSDKFTELRMKDYDKIARELLIEIAQKHPIECISTYVYYKPIALIKDMAWIYGFRRDLPDIDVFVSADLGDAMAIHLRWMAKMLDEHRQRFILWNELALLVVGVFGILIACEGTRYSLGDFVPLVVLTIGTVIPTVAGYPGMHTIAEPVLMAPALFYSIVAVALGSGLRASRRSWVQR
jgi:hypothetical protein